MRWMIFIAGAYLVGSIPFGLILAWLHGKDLRRIGSGNIGATNLARALGRRWGYFCFVLDVLKGVVPMAVGRLICSEPLGTGELFLWLAVGCAAVLGHVFPIYAGFRGGKGVATSFGVALGLWPYFTVCAVMAFGVWVVVVLLGRYISLGSIAASVAFPIVFVVAVIVSPGWSFGRLWPLVAASSVIPLMVIVRHRGNIRRLLAGTESKIASK